MIIRVAPVAFAVLVGLISSVRLSAQAVSPFTSNASVHDPSVVRDGGTFYVFGSHLASAKSTDLMNWTQISTSAAAGNALVPNPQAEFQVALAWASTATFWAPDVIKLADGRYYFYYCTCEGSSPRSALGIAVADAIEGPYKNLGIILKSGMWGQASPDGRVYDATIHPNTVDPSVFFDQAGKLWMVYGSYSGGIFIMELEPTTGFPRAGQGYGKKLMGGNHARIEGAYILYSPESGYYYLFVSFGGLNAADGYNIRVGRSRTADGPYLDAVGTDLTSVAGAPGTLFDDASIAPHGVKLMGGYQFLHVAGEPQSTSRGYLSPGHNSAYYDPIAGKHFLVFHTRFVGRGEQHEVRVHQMFMNADDWLVVAPHRYTQETITATDVSQIPGEFKLINHGKAISGGAVASVPITLRADGTVSGSVAGTWTLSGGSDATLVLAGITYKGVFVRQWDDDNRVWVLAFTALSGDGTAVWGSKVAVAVPDAAPVITAQPLSQSAAVGSPVAFAVIADGSPLPAFQWRKDGVNISGATGSSYSINSATTGDAGNYTVVVTNSVGSVTSAVAALTVAARPDQVIVPHGDATAQIVNLSTRGIVATGEDVLIAGFVIAGTAEKKLLILASGLNLSRRFQLTGEIGRPRLTLIQRINNVNVTLAENNDWQLNRAELTTLIAQVGAQPLSDSTDPAHGDAGIVVTLRPGVYTVVLAPDARSANQDGIGLVELYDVTPDDGSRLVNISSRGRIETGARQMIVGVVVRGPGQERLMIRAVGPALKDLGVTRFLSNPSQTIYQASGGLQTVLARNDDWGSSAQADQIATLAPKLGAFSLAQQSADSVILRQFEPGVYTAIIAPSDAATGVALAEIYDANQP